ncbi:hypothetical protein AA0120_g11669 [Alternaria tenuissima]|nr:hypothetical protein AA0120_g11669 [Alternaria tenuissima]
MHYFRASRFCPLVPADSPKQTPENTNTSSPSHLTPPPFTITML